MFLLIFWEIICLDWGNYVLFFEYTFYYISWLSVDKELKIGKSWEEKR